MARRDGKELTIAERLEGGAGVSGAAKIGDSIANTILQRNVDGQQLFALADEEVLFAFEMLFRPEHRAGEVAFETERDFLHAFRRYDDDAPPRPRRVHVQTRSQRVGGEGAPLYEHAATLDGHARDGGGEPQTKYAQ